MKHYKVQNISEDFAGNFYPTLSDLILMLYNAETYRGLPLRLNPIRCKVCKQYWYFNRYWKKVYNRSVICPKCRKKKKKNVINYEF